MTILSKKTDQSGRSMVEMLGVLAIIGVLSVGGISGYSKAMAKFKLTKAQDQITMLLMNIRTAYATSPSYSGLSEAIVIDYNIAPNEMVSGTNLFGTFGGAVHIGPAARTIAEHQTANATANTAGNYFYITLMGLGKEACRSLATSDWGADGLVKMMVGGSGETPTHTYEVKDLPVGLTDAAGDCNAEVSNITWVYY